MHSTVQEPFSSCNDKSRMSFYVLKCATMTPGKIITGLTKEELEHEERGAQHGGVGAVQVVVGAHLRISRDDTQPQREDLRRRHSRVDRGACVHRDAVELRADHAEDGHPRNGRGAGTRQDAGEAERLVGQVEDRAKEEADLILIKSN